MILDHSKTCSCPIGIAFLIAYTGRLALIQQAMGRCASPAHGTTRKSSSREEKEPPTRRATPTTMLVAFTIGSLLMPLALRAPHAAGACSNYQKTVECGGYKPAAPEGVRAMALSQADTITTCDANDDAQRASITRTNPTMTRARASKFCRAFLSTTTPTLAGAAPIRDQKPTIPGSPDTSADTTSAANPPPSLSQSSRNHRHRPAHDNAGSARP